MTTAAPRVLIVDDDADVLEALGTFLRGNGLAVLTASTGQEGVRVARVERPDLVIMDVMMEERTAGFYAAREVRETPALRHVPIIILTSLYTDRGQPAVPPDPRWLPYDVVVGKPPDMPALLATVRALLARVAEAAHGAGGVGE